MDYNIFSPKKALNPAYLKVKPQRAEIELFKTNLTKMLDQAVVGESEEFHKNLISEFLKETYYASKHYINTKERLDLVIHNGKDANSTVGVIMEIKSPTNKNEMISKTNINAKALRELVLYYLRERVTNKNIEMKYLIATNLYEWFIFDAVLFENKFMKNKELLEVFRQFTQGSLVSIKTDSFYRDIAGTVLKAIEDDVVFTHFDLRDYEKTVRNADKTDDNKLIALYKILSPEHLLKQSFANDSNSLDKTFYKELLHIIGLGESSEGSKKIIGRLSEKERSEGSLIENAILQLDSMDKITRLQNGKQYGETYTERLFSVALELGITWVNRILFLKLLEAQLISYHKGDKDYAFLNSDKIKGYDDLNALFFMVLAKKTADRNESVKKLFSLVPYLNSSLFEPTELEHNGISINQLKDNELPLHSSTVLKDANGRRRSGKMNSLQYLFEFLNAYDFSAEGGEDISEDNKSLINASVLGLIFEKINGYKDGSFFTPGFITMYMAKETISRAVVQKFNETKGWNCTDLDQLYDKIEDKAEANSIINSLKVCDPAVGSGHFLVSVLNEIIAIKSDLKILCDRNGKRLKEYDVKVVNDELVVTDDDGNLFEYNPKSPESQRVQETLFHEKQTIIESCLFGVDINPNSVKICRLRLWIELLKNAYYRTGTDELETLPNIDINIKCGNSLISRFALDEKINKFIKKFNFTLEDYKQAVFQYKNASNKAEKLNFNNAILLFKKDLQDKILEDKVTYLKRYQKEYNEIEHILSSLNKSEQKIKKDEQKKILKNITQQEEYIEQLKFPIYDNAFEWRFEFPEVLNDEGEFVGFDVVIGNPPYIRVQDLQHNLVDYYKTKFSVAHKRIDISILFLELGHKLLSANGFLSYITSNQFLKAEYGRNTREYLKGLIKVNVDYSKVSVFDGLATYVSVFLITKNQNDKVSYILIENAEDTPTNFTSFNTSSLSDEPWNFNINQLLKTKIFSNKKILNDIAIFTYGVITGLDKAFLVPIKEIKQKNLESEITKEFIRPQNYKKYHLINQTFGIVYPYKQDNSIISENDMINLYPNCFKFLSQFKTELENRKDSRTTIKAKGLE